MKRALAALFLAALAVLVGVVIWLNLRGEGPSHDAPPLGGPLAEAVARGAYLVRAGNCMTCHTQRGGTPFAGGRPIATPFGTVYSSNLTPDPATGIGEWTADDFWRAMHNGRSRDGRLLYPAFPYPNYTLVTRDDSDAIYHYLRSLAPVEQPDREHELRWPYGTQVALAVWRALYFTPGTHIDDRDQSAEWNRGAYLVRGLGHCSACHAPRNALGATSNVNDLSGGLIPVQNWYAPSLNDTSEGGLAHWDVAQIERLFKTGVAEGTSMLGPMAEVVLHSTQYLSGPDLRAMAVYLKTLPPAPGTAVQPSRPLPPEVAQRGARLYERHCAQCHGDQGEGVPGAYPALAGNRAVNLPVTANLVQVVLGGAFAPATAGNARPYGMPPFATVMNDQDVAAVLSHVRASWGNDSPPVTALDVSRQRGSAIH